MNLRDWLYKKKITITAFSKSLNITRDHINSIVTGRRKAGSRLAKDITAATEGQVRPHEFADAKEKS
jgi:DNA-binding transcriptional regulator YdaS (Cro superfamily)